VRVLVRLALRNLWRNPRRTLLTVGATVFAVALTMLFESMASGMHKRWIEYIVRLYPGHVEVMARGYRDHRTLDYGIRLTGDRVRALDRLEGVEGWAPRVEAWALAMPDEEGALGRAGMLIGVDPERERGLSRLGGSIREGRFLDGTSERGVVLGTRLARAMGVGVGDPLILLSTDYYGSQAADRFQIVGTAEVGNPEFDGALILLRLDGIRRFLDYGDHMSHVAFFAERAQSSEELARELSGLFDSTDYDVVSWRQLLPDLDQLLLLDDVGNRFNLAILILVAGFGLLNTVLMSVFERVREFGVMRAMGARPRTLFGVVLLEATMLAVIGVIVGVAVAVPIILWFEGSPIRVTGEWAQMYELFQLEPIIAFDLERKNFLGTPLVMFAVALLAALPPAIRASRGHPVDAIRALTT
jgi:ABC-type lipoprotein release transport system permease subunit